MCGAQARACCAWTTSKAAICFRLSNPHPACFSPGRFFHFFYHVDLKCKRCHSQSAFQKTGRGMCLVIRHWFLLSPGSPTQVLLVQRGFSDDGNCPLALMCFFFKGLLIFFIFLLFDAFSFLRGKEWVTTQCLCQTHFCVWVLIKSPGHNVSWGAARYTLLLDHFPASACICPEDAITLRYNFILSPLPG